MSKNLNPSAMDDLMNGLVSPSSKNTPVIDEDEPVEPVKKKRQKKGSVESICATVNKELMDKVRSLASKEGLGISEIVNFSIERTIKLYEESHGIIKVKAQKKGSIDSVFGAENQGL